jgi:transposase
MYLSALYRRIASRRGAKIAMIAVGHSILVAIYHLLFEHVSYTDLGGNYFDERDRQVTEERLVRRLEKLGYHVELQATA